jgi:hypothetical protein
VGEIPGQAGNDGENAAVRAEMRGGRDGIKKNP